MKKHFFFAAAALALAACSNEEATTAADGPVALKVNAAISGTATRASGTAWADGDRIGVSTAGTSARTRYGNVPYVWKEGGFAPAEGDIYFQDAAETVAFSAYYPYEANATYTGVSTSAENQTAENRPKIDFLFAEGATADKEHPTVNFTDDHAFTHRMSQITIEFKEGDDVDFDGGRLTGYTLSGMTLRGSFDTATGEAAAAEEETADLAIALDDVATTGGVYATSVIVFPQGVSSIGLSVAVEGQVYNATLAVPAHNAAGGLQAGVNYRFPVTVSKTGLAVGEAAIKDWETVTGNGGTAKM